MVSDSRNNAYSNAWSVCDCLRGQRTMWSGWANPLIPSLMARKTLVTCHRRLRLVYHAGLFSLATSKSSEQTHHAPVPHVKRGTRSFLLLVRLALLLQHLLDNLLLLDEERSHDAVSYAARAARTAVRTYGLCQFGHWVVRFAGLLKRTLDGLLGLGDLSILARSEGRNLEKTSSAKYSRNVVSIPFKLLHVETIAEIQQPYSARFPSREFVSAMLLYAASLALRVCLQLMFMWRMGKHLRRGAFCRSRRTSARIPSSSGG